YVTREEYETQFTDIFDQILAFAAGRPINVINPDVLAATSARGGTQRVSCHQRAGPARGEQWVSLRFARPALPPGHEALIVAGAASARERGTVSVEGGGATRSDGLSLRAAATRDSLLLGRSRCRSRGGQNNGGGTRKCSPE